MKAEVIGKYAERVYGHAVHHTYTRDEADELSQEILLAAIRGLPKLRDESKLEPWLWGMASRVTKAFHRSMGKHRAMYAYDVPESLPYEAAEAAEAEEYTLLRAKIAMLSEGYCKIIILSTARAFPQKRLPKS